MEQEWGKVHTLHFYCMTQTVPGYVYLIRAFGTNRCKIGQSINLKTQLQQLQRQSPYPLETVAAFKSSNPAWDEAHWQEIYKEHRVYGEWLEFEKEYYKDIVKICFWSGYEELKVAELATALAKSQGIDWETLLSFHPNKYKYFQEASDYLKVGTYGSTAHSEV